MMGSGDAQLHVIFLPYMAPGHMMPLVDIARLFATHPGVKVTIITTPMNAQRFQTAIDRDTRSGNQISLHVLPFPSAEAGLPEGCENLSNTPTPEMSIKLFHAIDMLRPKIEHLLRELRPDAIVSDILFHWTVDVAIELGVPRIAFSGSGFFNLSVGHIVEHLQPHKDIESETQPFVVPNLPDEVTLTRAQLPDIVKTRNKFSELFDKLKEAERKSFGMVVNSFYELESGYADYYRKDVGRAWHIGPVSLYNKDEADKVDRGEKTSINQHNCLNWLDSKRPNSVLYVCFGSLTRFSKRQLVEMAAALEESGHSFIWVVGKVLKTKEEEEEEGGGGEERWLPAGFEERMRESGRGMIIRGWAPQVMILEHPAIGGFLTHCGWNSVLEGVTSGVPMITWPIFADQFYNEKLITQVMKFGAPVGNEVWKVWATEETELICQEKIRKAVEAVMGEGEDAKEMRKRARQLGQMAKKAVEGGGSSDRDLKALIDDIRSYKLR